eukprot:TRINITY_DN113721_c0_g1_i1.p2 TRINITY_DN113721_c0_g1~~TRINITY_DN113721_c0_g1_i1.p2  ORF type:complete len:103 (-),score=20.76 TRINITY_DN113721_c0_g1_i1:89-397(-)
MIKGEIPMRTTPATDRTAYSGGPGTGYDAPWEMLWDERWGVGYWDPWEPPPCPLSDCQCGHPPLTTCTPTVDQKPFCDAHQPRQVRETLMKKFKRDNQQVQQ